MLKWDSEYHTDINRGYSAAFASALILSLTAIFIRHLTQAYQIPALVLAFWREAFVAAGLLVIFLLKDGKQLGGVRGHIGYLVLYGFILALFNACWTISVTLNGASVSTVLAYSSAGFTVLLGWALLKEPITGRKGIAVLLSLIGSVLVVNALDASMWRLNALGIGVGITSGVLYALYSILGRRAAARGLNSWTTLLYIFGFGSIFLLLLNLLSFGRVPGSAVVPGDLFWLGTEWTGWLILLTLALGPTLTGYGLYNKALVYLPSSVANLIVTIEPIFTSLIAFILFGEVLSVQQIIGGFLIMAAVLVLRLGNGNKKERV